MADKRPLRRLQAQVLEVDRRSFFVDDRCYADLEALDIVRHDLYHLVKLIAKVANFCDQNDHNLEPSRRVLEDEVIPDLVIYALQFANALGVDLDEKFECRLEQTLNKFYVPPDAAEVPTRTD